MTSSWLTVADLAARLQMSAEWVRDQVRSGRFPSHRLADNAIRFTEADVAAIDAESLQPARGRRAS